MEFPEKGCGFRVSVGLGFRVQGLGFRVQGVKARPRARAFSASVRALALVVRPCWLPTLHEIGG